MCVILHRFELCIPLSCLIIIFLLFRSLWSLWLDGGHDLPTQALDPMLLILISRFCSQPFGVPPQAHQFSISTTSEYLLGDHKVQDLSVCTLR